MGSNPVISLHTSGNVVSNNISCTDLSISNNCTINDSYTFPIQDGSSGQILETDGSGTLSFKTITGSDISLNDLSDCKVNGVLIVNSSYYIGGGANSTHGFLNTCVGYNSGNSITSQDRNSFIGARCGENNIGQRNCAIGTEALMSSSGSDNIAMGVGASVNTSGSYTIAIGSSALYTSSGNGNIAIGYNSSYDGTTGSNNITIGYNSSLSSTNVSDEIVIGSNSTGHGSNIVVIGSPDCIAWHPSNNNTTDLGSSTYKFKDLYLNDTINANNLKISSGGNITQTTNKSTDVTLDSRSGKITLNNYELINDTIATFTVTNGKVLADDVIIVTNDGSVGDGENYLVWGHNIVGGSSFKISVKNISNNPLSEAIVLNFILLTATTS